jgi:hypothetical protein
MTKSSAKRTLRLRVSSKTLEELILLLGLNNDNLRKHSVGKLIREDFKHRGWLKGKVRGKPGDPNQRQGYNKS